MSGLVMFYLYAGPWHHEVHWPNNNFCQECVARYYAQLCLNTGRSLP